jgi:hypothetical protein
MARTEVVNAVEKRLAELWHHCPVIFQNVIGETPEDGSPWMLVQFPVSNTDRVSVSTRTYREEGGIRFVLHLPRGEGTSRALLWSGELARLFRYQKFDGVETQTPSSPFIDDENENGFYFAAAVTCPYTFNFSDEE